MKITLHILRFNRETDSAPYYRDYPIEVEPSDRVLDALMQVKRVDPTLAVRKSCAHGICGSDAMLINGIERLACKTLVKDIASEGGAITLEPMRSMPVERDLMVDQGRFFENYRTIKPYFISAQQPSGHEFVQTPQQRARVDDPIKCILCGACFSSCPVVAQKKPRFIGPAAIVQAARFVFDSRDKGLGERIDVLDMADGAWACENHFNCTKVCPRGIKVTKTINETKRAITLYKEGDHQTP